jgi:glycosyltransferase involved in cell wall biosynthesis
MTTAALVSFRLGGTDGVSIVARSWADALRGLGFDVVTVAGEGPVDRIVAGLALGASVPPSTGELEAALADAELVVVENLLTIPMNLPASRVVAGVLAGRPAVLHHHDPPWQRPHYAHITELPPRDATWRHVTINDLTRRELAERGIDATTVYNAFDRRRVLNDRAAVRASLGVDDDELLFVHPVRAIARKGIDRALAICEAMGATYWLTGPVEDDYGDELRRLLGAASCRVIEGTRPYGDLYGAADAVLFPSTWEGFGNPPVEASLHGLPVVVGDYPVADELRALGFEWLRVDQLDALAAQLAEPVEERARRAARHQAVVEQHLSPAVLSVQLRDLLDDAGWLP